MVQGIFDDLNPDTVGRWAYPDTGYWDPDRNVNEYVEAMGHWRQHGLLAVTLNLQGGCPYGYCSDQPWHNSALAGDGELRQDYTDRLELVLDRADELGMVVILGIYYFGQDQRLWDEAAVINGVDNVVNWILDRGYRNVIIEVNNECNISYDHDILRERRVHELIQRVQSHSRDGYRLLASTSFSGGRIPSSNVVRQADFILLHGNGVSDPHRIAQMVDQTRNVSGYEPKPILFNEDDHFNFDAGYNNMVAAIDRYASWGFFDPGHGNYHDGYQCVPVDWEINTSLKKEYFCKVSNITGVRAVNEKEGDSCCENIKDSKLIIPPAPACGMVTSMALGLTMVGLGLLAFVSRRIT